MQQVAQRPMGVTVLAVLAMIGGVFGLLGALGLVLAGGVASAVGSAGLGAMAMVLGLFVFGVSGLELAFGVGAWMLKPWAWTLGVVSQGLSVLVAVVSIATGNGGGSQVFNILIAGVIVYYLFTPPVKQAFGKA